MDTNEKSRALGTLKGDHKVFQIFLITRGVTHVHFLDPYRRLRIIRLYVQKVLFRDI